ncbi:unnamed protein product (macronuclear) [Paramecium tetraurelia]|uniref:Uncharacterized protein n=1 Tax=Paramecium tetraurelia TaxID=5888 RepID=A0CD42_PARTE|nr:uncharacterized protein GSPATT00037494001 [Paramecium tetraurelia]CAK68709.1 unnamed protein product [Paramecium tetraurelia]|eukprot:XP_001436106.1 hypothetical protein (macronuclear) [Paramecium tetraurelia strain d4-2]
MGCCATNNNYSQQLHLIRYQTFTEFDISYPQVLLEQFNKQLDELIIIKEEMNKFITTSDFSEEDYLIACRNFFDRHFHLLKTYHSQKTIEDSIIIEQLGKMREFISNVQNEIKSADVDFEKWEQEFLVNINCLEQESGELGEFYIIAKSEQNLIKIITVLGKFDDKILNFHQVWLQDQISQLRERLFRQSEQVIVNYSNYLINYLKTGNDKNLYKNLQELSKLSEVKVIEQLGYRLAQQLLQLRENQQDILFKSEFLDIAYNLQQCFTQNYDKYIIQPVIEQMDDFLIQEEIQLSSLTILLEAFGLAKMEIFDQDFYCFHIHKAETSIKNIKEMSQNFEQTFTKYQLQFITKQKQNLQHALQIFEPFYQLSMKKISQKIAEQINQYFSRLECITLILNASKRQEQKLSVFIQNYGQRCSQDLQELQKNSNKFLDLKGLKLNQSTDQVTQMIQEYQVSFQKMQQLYLCNLGAFITKEADEISQLTEDKHNEQKKRIDQLIQNIDIAILNAKNIMIKTDDTDLIEKQLTMALDKLIYNKDQKKRASQLSDYALKQKQQRKSTTVINSPHQETNNSKQIRQNTPKGVIVTTSNNNQELEPWAKLKRIPLKIISQCGKCDSYAPYQVKHELCQTDYFLDMNGFVRCSKRLISSPKEKSCKLKHITEQSFVCPYCKAKFQLNQFHKFIQAIIKGLDYINLPFESKDILLFFRRVYEDFSKIYYNYQVHQQKPSPDSHQ